MSLVEPMEIHRGDGLGVFISTIEVLLDKGSLFRAESPHTGERIEAHVATRYLLAIEMMGRVRAATSRELAILETCLQNYSYLPPEAKTMFHLVFAAEGEPTDEDERHAMWARIADERRRLYSALSRGTDEKVPRALRLTIDALQL